MKAFDNQKKKTCMIFMPYMGPNCNINKKKLAFGCMACSRQTLLPWSKSTVQTSLRFSFASFQKYMFCFQKYMPFLHSTPDISFQTITGVVLSLTLGCSSWMHLTSSRRRIYLHDLRTWYVQCLNFPMMQTIMFWWIGLMKHNSVAMKPPCANRWVKSLWSWQA